MNKRVFVFFCILSTAFLPTVSLGEAQQTKKVPRVVLLTFAAPPQLSTLSPFEQGLRKLGYVEGQNIAIERRYANGQIDRLPELAAELVRHQEKSFRLPIFDIGFGFRRLSI